MKKFFASLLAVLCCSASIYADDVAEVKRVIVKDYELVLKGDYAGVLALRAPDFEQVCADGETISYTQTKWMFLLLDGKHPAEFWLLAYYLRAKRAMPSEAQQAVIREKASAAKYREIYEMALPELLASVKREAELELKTLKFVDVKVDGDRAVAEIEYESRNESSGAIERKSERSFLRRENGAWRFYRSVVKDRK